MNLEKYRFLFDGSRPNWILLMLGGREKIYNKADGHICRLEPEIEAGIIARMKERGVEIIDQIPLGKKPTPRAEIKSGDWDGLLSPIREDELPDDIRQLMRPKSKKG